MGEACIRVHRVRAAVSLVGEVGEIGRGTEAARRHLLEELLRLLGAVIGAAVHDTSYGLGLKAGIAEATLTGFDRQLLDVFQAHHTRGSDFNPFHGAVMRRLGGVPGEVLTGTNGDLVAGRDWDASVWINDYVRPARIDHFVGTLRKMGEATCHGCGFMRAAGDRPFSEEDREVLHLVHLGIGRLFEAPSPRARLAPRVREALDVLLSGATDKEIAAQLGIGLHTARQYVKAILLAHGVASRSQLLARAAERRL